MTEEEKALAEKEKAKAEANQKIIQQYIQEEKLPPIRALTRKERKEMDKKGLNFMKTIAKGSTFIQAQEECFDWILDTIYKDFDFSELPNNLCYVFATQVYGATYSDTLSEKN